MDVVNFLLLSPSCVRKSAAITAHVGKRVAFLLAFATHQQQTLWLSLQRLSSPIGDEILSHILHMPQMLKAIAEMHTANVLQECQLKTYEMYIHILATKDVLRDSTRHCSKFSMAAGLSMDPASDELTLLSSWRPLLFLICLRVDPEDKGLAASSIC